MPDDGKIKFYGLSTCMWCKKTKKLLEEELHVELDITWVNEVEGAEKEEVRKRVKEINPDNSFPTVDFGDGLVVVGYKPDKIEEAVKQWQARKK